MDDVFRDYFGHQESKFEGVFGVLDRIHILVRSIIHIGKESNKLEVSNIIGVDRDGYQIDDDGSINMTDREMDFIQEVTPTIVRRFGICRGELHYLREKIRKGISLVLKQKTISRLRTMFEAMGITT